MRARVPTPRESRPSKAEECKHIPKPYKLRRYYTPKEVAAHNTADDVWVSLFDKVYDLSLLISRNHRKPECDPIVLAAGTDISHWFDYVNLQVSLLNTNNANCFILVSSRKPSSIPRPDLSSSCAPRAGSYMFLPQNPTATGTLTSPCRGGKTRPVTALVH